MYPEKKLAVIQSGRDLTDPFHPPHDEYTTQYDTNGFALRAGAGLKLNVNSAIAIKVATVDYTKSWVTPLNGSDFSNGLQITAGLVVKMGTW